MAEGNGNGRRIDPAISLGSLLTMGLISVAMGAQFVGLSNGQARLEAKIDERFVIIGHQLDRAERDHDQVTELAAAVRELIEARKHP